MSRSCSSTNASKIQSRIENSVVPSRNVKNKPSGVWRYSKKEMSIFFWKNLKTIYYFFRNTITYMSNPQMRISTHLKVSAAIIVTNPSSQVTFTSTKSERNMCRFPVKSQKCLPSSQYSDLSNGIVDLLFKTSNPSSISPKVEILTKPLRASRLISLLDDRY